MLILPIAALRNIAGQLDRRATSLPGNAASAEHRKLAVAYLRTGERMSETGCVENSLDCYRKALRLATGDPDLHYEILFKLERLNRVDEAWAALQALEQTTGAPCAANHPLHLVKARLEYRRGKPEIGRAMLEQFLRENPDHTHRYLACGWLGAILDELGQYDAAMEAFDAKNAALLRTPAAARLLHEHDAHLEALAASLHHYDEHQSFGWRKRPSTNNRPILLVGFPRSGTTLLDQLLDAHPALTVIEEMPTLNGLSKRFFGNAERLAALENLRETEANACRKLYWSNVAEFLARAPDASQIVDKLPLNTMHLDLYARLFPDVKIIVALRDPRDVILSNYMQMYQLNASMAANLDLVRSARYYAAVMGLYLNFRRFLPDNIHEVKYENLVHDFAGEGEKLMRFLGLEWDEKLLHFHANTQRRRIATPSYHQVIKPIYRSAAGRWKHYQSHMQHALPLLKPYIEAFGY